MASKDDIRKTILQVAGNPVAGPVASLAAQMADEIAKLDEPNAVRGKQKRIVEPVETRTVSGESLEADEQ